jgi:hypothetical protein
MTAVDTDIALAARFLAQWVEAFIEAEPEDRGTDADAARECVTDAADQGIAAHNLMQVAGGDVSKHLAQAALCAT